MTHRPTNWRLQDRSFTSLTPSWSSWNSWMCSCCKNAVKKVKNCGKEKKRTLCFASFCLTMDLNHRKSMTILKLCKKSSKCDVAGHCSFIRLEMAMVWRKKSLIEKSAYFNFFPMSNFSLSVFVNNAAQDCHSYSLSMSKLKSFKSFLKWRQ